MTYRDPAVRAIMASGDEKIPPLEWTVHKLHAEAVGLPQLIRTATPEEIEAVRAEAIQSANMILSYFEVKQ